MKKVKLFYNPIAGDRSFCNELDRTIAYLQDAELQVCPYRLCGEDIPDIVLADITPDDYHAVIAAGGDGTIHQVVKALDRNNIDAPLAIFPTGTSNDFASYLNLPRNIKLACDIIVKGYTRQVDLGTVNGTSFINVLGGGLLTDVPQKTDVNLKNVLGKLAYYLKGLEQLPNFRPINIEMRCAERVLHESVFFFLVLNSSVVGSFARLVPNAIIDDGKLDVLVVKTCSITEIIAVFIKFLRGEHLSSPFVEHFQTEAIEIMCDQSLETDIDGEAGPAFPLKIGIKPKTLKVLIKE